MPHIAEDRPPYVTFEKRAEENRQATIEQGHFVATDVDYALITPMGSKDRIERPVKDWFAKLEQDVTEGRFPRQWLDGFRVGYKAWAEGQEAPVNGTAVENWPAASPAQIKTLRGLNVRTVEDLANANEETLGRIGMGGRALKQRAVDWLAASGNTGKISEEMTALRVKNEALEARNKTLEDQLRELAAKVEALATAKAGTPTKL